MTYKELIAPKYVKSMFPEISSNVDDSFLNHSINRTQRMRMRTVIGQVYMNDLMTTLTNSGETGLTTDDKYILDTYFRPIQSLYVYAELVESLSYQLDNSGLRVKNVDESSIAPDTVIIRKQKFIEKEISAYLNELNDFLCDNKDLYPLYFINKNNSPNVQKMVFHGIYLCDDESNDNGLDWDNKIIY